MSNFTGGNPARGTNKSHRNAMFRNPSSFRNAVLPHGAISFLICAGNMRGAVHDGKTCGGVAHFPLFSPGTNFDPLYDLLDAAADGDDGNSGGDLPDPVPVPAPAPVAPAPAPAPAPSAKTAAKSSTVAERTATMFNQG